MGFKTNIKKRKIIATAIAIVIIAIVTLVLLTVSHPTTVSNEAKNIPEKTNAKDTTAPTIQLNILPASLEAAKTTHMLGVAVIVKDDRAVVKVEHRLDDKATTTSTKSPFGSMLDISKLAVGDHTLQAYAYDAAGNRGESEPFTFRLNEGHNITPTKESKTPAQQFTIPGSSGMTSPPPSGGDTPPPSGSCPLPAYPSASCTGVPANTILSIVTGNMTINTPNTILEGQDIRGCVNVTAPGVIIRKSKIACAGSVVGNFSGAYSGTGLLLEDVEIDCMVTNGTAVGDTNLTARRVNIHGCENGFDVDKNVTIEDSYIHDLAEVGADPHTDGIQITTAGENVTIRHNTIYLHGTSAIISPKVSSGVISNILIQSNLVAGGAFTIYCQQEGPGNNYRVIDNHFSTILYPTVGAYGPWTDCDDETQVTGNVYHESGLPVPF
jgi:hypothetical protein